MADFPLYGTADLMALQNLNIYAPPPPFWLQFYQQVFNSSQEKIYFDEIDVQEKRLAPFVAPNVQGRLLRQRGFTTKSFAPAYVKPKHKVSADMTIKRLPGEQPFYGTLTRAERWDRIVANNMAVERQVIQNRMEWMAAQATINGSVTVAGEDYPEVTVDFGRDPSLDITLTGAATWDNSTAQPLVDLQSARTQAFKLGKAAVTDIIMGTDAYSAFSLASHTDVRALLNIQTRGTDGINFNITQMFDVNGIQTSAQLVGTFGGSNGIPTLRLWVYSNSYDDGTGNMVELLDPTYVIGVGVAAAGSGVKAYGAIEDSDAGFASVDMFPKMWKENGDPGGTFTMTQAAPLVIPMRPNNTFKMKVLA